MYLGRTICALLDLTEKSQTQLADAIGVRRPTITALINDGTRPHPNNLGAICKYWERASHGTECLIAHLRDEIMRAGLSQSRVTIHASDGAEDTITALSQAYESDELMRCLLDDLAALIASNAQSDLDAPRIAAETRTDGYQPDSRS